MSKIKILIIVVCAVLALLIIGAAIFAGCCYFLATTDNIADKYTLSEDERDENYLSEVVKGTLKDDDFLIGENTVNTFINEKYCTDFNAEGSGIENICVRFHENEDTDIYARVYTGGRHFAVSAKGRLSFTNDKGGMEIELHDMKIGELAISDGLLKYLLPKYYGGSDKVRVEENRITFSAIYTYETKYSTIELYFTKFSPVDGGALCRTNSLKKEAVDALRDYVLSDDFKEKVTETYNAIKNRISDILH